MPKIVQYNLPPGGTIVDVAANNATALDIEQAGADYITVDTTGSGSVIIGKTLTLEAGFATSGNIEIENASPTLTFDNSTAEDTDNGRESQALFTGLRTGGGSPAATTLGKLLFSHHGTGDDNKSQFYLYTNDNSDANAAYVGMHIGSDGRAGFGQENNGNSQLQVNTAEGDIEIGRSDASVISFQRSDTSYIRAEHASGNLRFQTGGSLGANSRLLISNDGKISTGNEGSPLCKAGGIHLLTGTQTGQTASTDAQDMVIESDATELGISFLGSATCRQRIQVGDANNAGSAGMSFNHNGNDFTWWSTGGQKAFYFLEEGYLQIGTSTPTAMLTAKGNLDTQGAGTIESISTATVTGSGTAFLTKFTPGSAIEFTNDADATETRTVLSVASDTELVLTETPGATGAGRGTKTYFHDPDLFAIETGDGSTRLKFDSLGQLTVCDTATTNVMVTDGDIVTMTGQQNTIIGAEPRTAMTTNLNTRVGMRAGKGSSGANTTMVGAMSGEGASSGTGVVLLGYYAGNAGAGGYCTGVGQQALAGNQSGGTYNTGVGSTAGNAITTGDQNVCIGAGSDAAATESNQIAIGYEAIALAENTAVIGDANIISLATGGNGVCSLGTSSKTFKEAFITQGLIQHTVTDDCWPAASSLIVGGTNNAGIYIKAASSAYSSTVAFADGVGTSAESIGGALQYVHASDIFRIYTKWAGSNEYIVRMNEYGAQKFRNSLAQDSTARDDDTDTDRPAYLATTSSTNDTLILDYDFGTVAEVTLTNNITAIKVWNAPPHGSSQTMTVKIKQHSTAVTLSYSSVTISDGAPGTTKAGNLLWAGGVAHTLSTADNAIDIVQFTCMPHGDTNRDIYGAVIGQAFA